MPLDRCPPPPPPPTRFPPPPPPPHALPPPPPPPPPRKIQNRTRATQLCTEPSEVAFHLTHGSACIIGLQSGLPNSLISTYIAQFMMSANIRIRFGLQMVLVCYSTPSHHHHGANLSEGIEPIKCLSDIFCRVCE